MRLMLQHGDQIRRAVIDKVVKIPGCFFEAADVYSAQRFCAVDTDFVGSESYHWTMFFVKSEESADARAVSSFGPDP